MELQDRVDDKMWLVKHLERTRQRVLDDLIIVKVWDIFFSIIYFKPPKFLDVMLLSLGNLWLVPLYAIFNWTLSDALGGRGRYERLLSSKLQNSRGFFSKSVLPSAKWRCVILAQSARIIFCCCCCIFRLSLKSHSPSLPSFQTFPLTCARALILNQSKNTSCFAVYLSREETLVS